MWVVYLAILIVLVGMAIGRAIETYFPEGTCPRCKRELHPDDHHGFNPHERLFCRFCKWEQRDGR